MIRYLFVFLCVTLTHTIKAQYFVLEGSNATYAYFVDQDMYVEWLLEYGFVHDNLALDSDLDLRRDELLSLSDRIKDCFSDSYSKGHFQTIHLENTLGNQPLESRKTFLYKYPDDTIDYLFQTRILFKGEDVEKEKMNPTISAILMNEGDDIIRLDSSRLIQAFQPQKKSDIDLLDIPPLPTGNQKVRLTNGLSLKEVVIPNSLKISIPEILSVVPNTQYGQNGVYAFKSKYWKTSLVVRKLSQEEYQRHEKRYHPEHMFDGFVIRNREISSKDSVSISMVEGTYFDDREALTCLLISGKDTFYVVTFKYPESDRVSSEELRKRMIESIILERKLDYLQLSDSHLQFDRSLCMFLFL